ncbi:MAG TPA: DUF4153 domain-containing protein [Gemmatimonadales bacterium]|nr:DUF4153 domain-containing protein [Gemmatimonadales bacterium]
MRFPTIGVVVTAASGAARRFPLVLAAAFVAAYAGIRMVHNSDDKSELIRLLTAATLGFPLLFALTVLAERRARTTAEGGALLGGGVAVLVAFWAAWPRWSEPIQAFRYVQLSVAFHLLVAFLPYARYAEHNGFWQYNRALFLRYLTASLYSGVLFVGLAIALLATNKLLGVDVPNEGYARLWVVITFVFNTWFFVGGVPQDLAALDSYDDYPTGLRIFTQYVLVPIVAIYLVILTLYLGKVLITRQWPSGWIGYLVSSVATVGILSWLLVHPLEERPEYAWVKTFTRGFYIALMPAIVMLWLAIWKRVEQYGITERRYFLIVLSVWLAAIAVYYTIARSRSIKVIPATLCGVALITFAGPWGAYGVSRASQLGRLQAILERNGLMANGHLQAATGAVSFPDRKEISSGFRYLLETHGEGAIASWLTDSLKHASLRGEPRARAIMTSLRLEYVTPWQGEGGESFYYYATAAPEPVAIAGYTQAVRISFAPVKDSIKVGDGAIVRLGRDSLSLRVERNGALLLELPLGMLVDSATAYRRRSSNQTLPPAMLRVEAQGGGAGALAVFTQLSGTLRQGAPRLTALEGELFLRLP